MHDGIASLSVGAFVQLGVFPDHGPKDIQTRVIISIAPSAFVSRVPWRCDLQLQTNLPSAVRIFH